MELYIGIGIAILLAIFILVLYNSSTKCHILNIKIDETVDNIKILLEKKLDIFTKLHKNINKDLEDKILEKVPKTKKKDLDIFELDEELNKIRKNFNETLEERKDIVIDELDKELIEELDNNDIELKGVKIYYNDTVKIFNKTIKKIPNNLIKMFKHYKTKETYTIEKEVDFEILKKK